MGNAAEFCAFTPDAELARFGCFQARGAASDPMFAAIDLVARLFGFSKPPQIVILRHNSKPDGEEAGVQRQ